MDDFNAINIWLEYIKYTRQGRELPGCILWVNQAILTHFIGKRKGVPICNDVRHQTNFVRSEKGQDLTPSYEEK